MTLLDHTGTAAQPLLDRAVWRRRAALPVLLGLVAVVVTAAGSWIPSFWGDEAASVLSAQRSAPSLWHEVSHVDAVHAVYYAAMHGWVHLFGASPFSMRFPSAIAVGVAVAGLVVLVRGVGGSPLLQTAAATAAMLVPRLDYQGEEARAYAIDAAIATWIVVVATATLQGRLRRRTGWVLVAALTVVGTYCFMYLGLMAVVVGLLAATLGRRGQRATELRWWAAVTGAVVVATAPLLVFGYLERAQIGFLAHRTTTDPYSLWVTSWFLDAPVAVVGWILAAVAVGTAAVVGVRRARTGGRRDADAAQAPVVRPVAVDPATRLAWIAVLWAFVPGVVLVAADPVLHDFSARYLTFTAPAAGLLVGVGVERLWRWRRSAAAIALVAAAVVVVPTWLSLRTPTSFNDSDWAVVGHMVQQRAHEGDQVAFDVTVRPSRRMLLAMRTYPGDFTGLEEVQVTTPYWENDSWDDRALTVDQAVAGGRFTAERVWLLQDAHGVVDHEGERALAEDGYRVVGHWRAPTSELVEFQR